MVHVIASIHVKPGSRASFLAIFKQNVPAVRAEPGCREYQPAIDIDAGMARQCLEADTVVIIEKWDSLEALRTHLATPHMTAYRDKVKDLVASVSLKVLQDA